MSRKNLRNVRLLAKHQTTRQSMKSPYVHMFNKYFFIVENNILRITKVYSKFANGIIKMLYFNSHGDTS